MGPRRRFGASRIDRRTPRRLALAIVKIALGLFVALLVARAAEGWWQVEQDYAFRFHHSFNAPQHDYAVYYAAGSLVRWGEGSELYDPKAVAAAERREWGDEGGSFEAAAYFNPPFVALAFVPYSRLPIGWASLTAGVSVAGAFVLLAITGSRLLKLVGWRYHVAGGALFLRLHPCRTRCCMDN